eukprot:scaffold5518_cov193-Ochromonas_danica.AAC.1
MLHKDRVYLLSAAVNPQSSVIPKRNDQKPTCPNVLETNPLPRTKARKPMPRASRSATANPPRQQRQRNQRAKKQK